MPSVDSIDQPSSRQIRAVCFDLGGVLVRINRNWQDALHAAGIRNGLVGELTAVKELEEFQIAAISQDEYLEALRKFLRIDNSILALQVHNLVLREPYAGTMELIEELHDQGIVTGCLSNTSAPHWDEMLLTDRFPNVAALQYRVASQEQKMQKPDPAMFQAFEYLVRARPQEIIFFDDTEDNVEAARERGWRAHWIDHDGDPAEQMELILISQGALGIP